MKVEIREQTEIATVRVSTGRSDIFRCLPIGFVECIIKNMVQFENIPYRLVESHSKHFS